VLNFLILLTTLLLWYNIWIYYIVIGIFTALLFCYDKAVAIKGKRRIPEMTLHLASFAGGAFGAILTICLIRHKSSKPVFYIPVALFTSLHVCLVLFLYRKGFHALPALISAYLH
jgi:uncharacterized membrane protein YsdA (DUF1294 family)